MNERVYITSIDILNIGGLEKFHADFGPGATCIVGENGVGKTSVLTALKLFFEGGANYDAVRRGELRGEATITFSDGSRAQKKLVLSDGEKEASYELKVLGPSNEVKKSPAAWIADRVPQQSFDPIAFLDSEPRKMAEFLLKHVPIQFTAAEVNSVLDTTVGKIPNVETFPHVSGAVDLQRYNEIRDTRYEERRQVNVQGRDLDGVISDLEKSLPSASDVDWAAERDRLQAEISGIETRIATKEADIRLEAQRERTRKEKETQDKIAALLAEQAEYIRSVDAAEAASIREQTAELSGQRALLSVDLGTAKSNADREQQAVGIRRAIEERKKAAKGLTLKEMRLSAVLEAMDKLKNDKLKALPIDGFDLKYDARKRPIITIHGVPLEQLNRQQQLFIAIQCIQLGSGSMPLILCEASELTETYLEMLADACREADPPIQLIVARPVKGEPLTVQAA